MKVLVIEDSKAFAAVIEARIKEDFGYQCIKATSLAQTKEMVIKHKDEVFAAIIDLNLPDAPKGEAIDYCLSQGLPSIVFTAQLNQDLRNSFIQKGVADYVLKEGSYNLQYISWATHRLKANKEKKVLIVDDALHSVHIMENLLKIQQYQTFTATSGEQAMEVLAKHPDMDIAIIDYFMQGINGYELASKIRLQYANDLLKIIGVSGLSDPHISAHFIKSGANDFLHKPFQPEEFYCRVNGMADHIDQTLGQRRLNEEKNQFLGMAAHDIRNPLGIIKKAAEHLSRPELKERRRIELLQMIERNSENMINLLSDLLDISTIESGHFDLSYEDIQLSHLIEERFHLYQPDAQSKNIRIHADLDPDLKTQLDPDRFRQVIDNLLTNAIKYSPLNSAINIVLEQKEADLVLTIKDTGPGIKQEELPKLFTAFEKLSSQTTAGETSTGLGLAIAKRIVEAHSGIISYADNKPDGACFSVTLPIKSPNQ